MSGQMEVSNAPETHLQAAPQRVISHQLEGRDISITPQYEHNYEGKRMLSSHQV